MLWSITYGIIGNAICEKLTPIHLAICEDTWFLTALIYAGQLLVRG